MVNDDAHLTNKSKTAANAITTAADQDESCWLAGGYASTQHNWSSAHRSIHLAYAMTHITCICRYNGQHRCLIKYV